MYGACSQMQGFADLFPPVIKVKTQKYSVAALSWQHRTLDFPLYQQKILVMMAMVAGRSTALPPGFLHKWGKCLLDPRGNGTSHTWRWLRFKPQ